MLKPIAKKIYNCIPLKKALFEGIKYVGHPPEALYRHLSFTGDFRVPVDDAHSFLIRHHGYEVENELFWQGLFTGREGTALQIWVALAKNSSVIFDVGANSGVFALSANATNPNAQVYAIEPIARIFEKLRLNCELNSSNVRCLEIAASDSDGEAEIFDFPDQHSYSSTFHRELFDNDKLDPVTVKTMRLDTLIEEHGVEGLDLMKLDVEGHEPAVLRGLGELLARHTPNMLVEVLTDPAGEEVRSLVGKLDYKYFYIDEDARTIVEVDEMVRRSYYNYLICSYPVANQIRDFLNS